MVDTRFFTYFGPGEIRSGSRRFWSLHTAAPRTGPTLAEFGADMNASARLFLGWRWRGRYVDFWSALRGRRGRKEVGDDRGAG